MRNLIITAVVFGSTSLAVIAKDPPLVEAEDVRYKTELDATIRRLNALHVERLTAIQKSLTAAGDLDGAVVTRDRIKAIVAAPNSPDTIAESAAPDTAHFPATTDTQAPAVGSGPATGPGVPTGLSVFEGKWILVSGDRRLSASFDKKGNFHSGMDAWGDVVCSRKGNTMIFPGHVFTIASRDLLQAIDKNGNPSGERLERVVEAPASKTPFGETGK